MSSDVQLINGILYTGISTLISANVFAANKDDNCLKSDGDLSSLKKVRRQARSFIMRYVFKGFNFFYLDTI